MLTHLKLGLNSVRGISRSLRRRYVRLLQLTSALLLDVSVGTDVSKDVVLLSVLLVLGVQGFGAVVCKHIEAVVFETGLGGR